LTFNVLSDLGNDVARQFGLVYPLPQELRDALSSSNKALPSINGDASWELPVPATYVITPNQRISLAFIEVDYRQRLAPQRLLRRCKSRRLRDAGRRLGARSGSRTGCRVVASEIIPERLARILLGRAQRHDLCGLVRRDALQCHARTSPVGCDRAAVRHRCRHSSSSAVAGKETPISQGMA
jgi:hypothetical protein